MEKIKLTSINTYDKNSKGEPYINPKTKLPYKIIRIRCEEYTEPLSGFISDKDDIRLTWKEGQTVGVNITRKDQYLNFTLPSREDYLEESLSKLHDRVTLLESMVLPEKPTKRKEDIRIIEPEDEQSLDQTPF